MNEDLNHLGLVDDSVIALDHAALTLAALDHPGIDLAAYVDMLDEVAARLEAVAGDISAADACADALSHVLGDEFGFVGNEATYDDPANADMIRVLDRRKGLPVSLSILYVAMARRLGWSAQVLDVPGHVLVLVGEEAAPVIVDPFRRGVRVTTERLATMLAAADHGPPAAVRQVSTMPNRAVLVRLLSNQSLRAERAGHGRRALELYARMTTVAPDHGHAWWERARLELLDGDVPAARRSLTAMLEITRDEDVRRKVATTLASLGVA